MKTDTTYEMVLTLTDSNGDDFDVIADVSATVFYTPGVYFGDPADTYEAEYVVDVDSVVFSGNYDYTVEELVSFMNSKVYNEIRDNIIEQYRRSKF